MRDFDSLSLSERLEGLTSHEALVVALDAYDGLRVNTRAGVEDVALATGLSPVPAIALLTLWQVNGRIVSMDTLSARTREIMGWNVTEHSYRASIKRIRRAVPEVEIITYARIGYALKRSPGQRAPWEKPDAKL